MTKKELYSKRYNLLKQTLQNYFIWSTNEVLNEHFGSNEDSPDVDESIFFVPNTDKELIEYLTALQNYREPSAFDLSKRTNTISQQIEPILENSPPPIRHNSNQLSFFDTDNADDNEFAKLDNMDGYSFQDYIADLFQKLGYTADVNNMAYDWGVDIFVKTSLFSIGVQCKISNTELVDNNAVQEIVAGIKHFKLDKGMVVTNNFYHKSTQRLAQDNNIILWNRNDLYREIMQLRRTAK